MKNVLLPRGLVEFVNNVNLKRRLTTCVSRTEKILRSACESTQSDQTFSCSLEQSVNTGEFQNE